LGIEQAVIFAGSVPHIEVVEFYRNAHFILNPSQTGSMDKTLLEGICAGAIPITSNIAYKDGLSLINPILYTDENTPQAFCDRVEEILKLENFEIDNIAVKCKDWVLRNHSLDSLADKLMSIFNSKIL